MKKNKPNILITEPEYFTKSSLVLMGKAGIIHKKRINYSELKNTVHKYDALVVRIETKIDKNIIAKAKRLKCVVTATTGLDHIDISSLEKLGIPLFSLINSHTIPTTEHAITLLLAMARNITGAHQEMISGGWNRWKYIGTEVNGKTLGIFGIGKIGSELAQRAKAFGMKIMAYDPFLDEESIANRGAQKVSWNTLLKKSDFLSIHSFLTEKTRGCFGEKEFKKMKPSSILINVARGAIIQDKALINALSKNYIRGAALDVYSEEPLHHNSPLRKFAATHNNLLFTPHLGGSTIEARDRASMEAAKYIVNFFKNHD